MQVDIRKTRPEAYDFILRLNRENEEILSPMDRDKLAFLDAAAELSVTAYAEERPAAFLIALRGGIKAYDLKCYQWFSERYADILYVDRVAVAAKYRHLGLGKKLYQLVFDHAGKIGAKLVAAGITTEPYNEASLRFHRKNGFAEVGELALRGGAVRASQQLAEVKRGR